MLSEALILKDKPILAIFDFCDTIFDGQSTTFFLDFLESKLTITKKILAKIIKKINKIPSSDSKRYKENLMRVFYGVKKEEMGKYAAEFYRSIVINRLHKSVIEALLWHQKSGHIIVVVSGGFEVYLRHFAKSYGIDYLISTKLEFKNGFFTSKIAGDECLGDKKVELLGSELNLKEFDLQNSFFYSDSRSDMPLFTLVGNKIVVKNTQNIDWIDDKFKVLKVNGSHA